MTWVKIISDMPLPTPRSVISSPSHMMTAVPAVIVMTMVVMVKIDWFGIRLEQVAPPVVPNRLPDLASATIPVDCSTARPTVR